MQVVNKEMNIKTTLISILRDSIAISFGLVIYIAYQQVVSGDTGITIIGFVVIGTEIVLLIRICREYI